MTTTVADRQRVDRSRLARGLRVSAVPSNFAPWPRASARGWSSRATNGSRAARTAQSGSASHRTTSWACSTSRHRRVGRRDPQPDAGHGQRQRQRGRLHPVSPAGHERHDVRRRRCRGRPRSAGAGECSKADFKPRRRNDVEARQRSPHRLYRVQCRRHGRSRAFYGAAFGWTFKDYGPTYCEFNDGRMTGGFTTGGPARPGGALIILYADDLAAAQRRLEKAGARITRPAYAFPGGRRSTSKIPTATGSPSGPATDAKATPPPSAGDRRWRSARHNRAGRFRSAGRRSGNRAVSDRRPATGSRDCSGP